MIVTWSRGAADDNMDEAILVELGAIIARHPWWIARAELVVRLLAGVGVPPTGRVIDAGCGWGTNLAALEAAGYVPAGLDISRDALTRLDRPGRTLIEADLSQNLPEDATRYDAVLALDVIEHMDDDRGAIARLARLTRPGGKIIVSVPALPELYSEFDRVQGHRRRYTPAMLRAAVEGGGLRVERLFWWGQWMAGILGRRKAASRARPGDTSAQVYARYLSLPPWPAPWLMKMMYRADQGRALAGRNRTGTSLFVVATPIEAAPNPRPT
jgi:SAM-dependent methyltransferase